MKHIKMFFRQKTKFIAFKSSKIQKIEIDIIFQVLCSYIANDETIWYNNFVDIN